MLPHLRARPAARSSTSLVLALAALSLVACGPRASGPSGGANGIRATPPPPDPRRHATPEDLADGVGTFTSIPWGFDTNSYWLEGPDGVVVIDTQFLPSEAGRLLDVIAAATPKPVVLAIVLHPNPDKFNGADVLRARGVRVVTSAQVLAQVPKVAASRRRAFLKRYASDYPTQDPQLESLGDQSTTLRAAGLELRVHVLGRGASEAHVVVEHRGHLFGGDLLVSATHAWLELGYVSEWLAQLDTLRALSPRRVHPGRGPSGGPELLDGTRAYLGRVQALAAQHCTGAVSTPAAAEVVRAQLEREYAAYAYPVFLWGVEGWCR